MDLRRKADVGSAQRLPCGDRVAVSGSVSAEPEAGLRCPAPGLHAWPISELTALPPGLLGSCRGATGHEDEATLSSLSEVVCPLSFREAEVFSALCTSA